MRRVRPILDTRALRTIGDWGSDVGAREMEREAEAILARNG